MKDSNSNSNSTTTRTEPIAQNVIKLISNLCFSIFVFSVLIFTVIAITYQPPDPWLQSSPALTNLFTQTQNSTFQIDTSVIKTGEDIPLSPQDSPLPLPSSAVAANATPAVTEALIQKSEEKITNSSTACEDLPETLNCSDPRVLITIQRFNLRAFKSISFFEYRTPVNGSVPGECDVSWRFRNKREKSWRKYRDFRRFKITVTDDCHYKVIHAGRFHSGTNARRNPALRSRTGDGKGKTVPLISTRDDEINDTIPTLGSESNFRNGKYLYYSRGGDYCKGMNHYMWSFLCGLGEAMFLNRTFVMDLSVCLGSMYNPSNKDEEGKDFRYYFDFEHLKEVASIVEEGEFLRDWKRWDKTHLKKRKVPVRKVVTHKVTPMQLQKDKTTVIWRQFDSPEPENYWYRVCEGQAAKYIQRPWHALWKSKRLMNIVTEISGRMDWDFDAVHVVRGIPSFGTLKNLNKLSLYMCNTSLAFEKCNILISDAFPNLEELNIDYCKNLVVLPNAVCDIIPLKKLSVTNCHKLSVIPQDIGKLENLKHLRLSSCTDLEVIPNSIGKLSILRHLDISNCISLTSLPEEFGNLFNLRNLYMASCASCELPFSVVNLLNLKMITCDEETATSWEAFQPMLPNMKIEVTHVDVNLNWLH